MEWILHNKSGLYWGFILVVFLLNVSSGEEKTVSDGSTSDKEPIQDALKPVYSMVKGFVEMVQPNDLNEIEDIVDKWTDKLDKEGKELSDIFSDEDFYDDVLWYMAGFLVCLVIGAILIITMFLTGCFMCCCRCCCGRCGGQVEPQEGKNAKNIRVVCGVLLFIFTTILLAGCLVLFMSNELLQEQTSTEPQALLPQIELAITRADHYKNVLIDDLEESIVETLSDKLGQTVSDLRQAPQMAKNAMNDVLMSTDVINQATDLVDSVEQMNRSMVEIEDYTNQLRRAAGELDNELDTLKNSISNTLNGCPGTLLPDCNDARDTVSNIAIQPDFDAMDDISQQMSNIRILLDSNPSLRQLVERGVEEYNRVSERVETETETEVTDVADEIDDINQEVKSAVDDFKIELDKSFQLNTTLEDIEDKEDDVEDYGTYRWYAGIGIGCMFLLIVVFYYFGLLCGCAGEPPYEDGASACNRGVGANLFMAGVVFTFLFFWIMMIIVMILFVIGGPLYSEICRNIVDIEDSPAIEPLNKILRELIEETDIDYDVELATIFRGCKNNGALYQVFSLDQIVNLTDVLDIDKYNLQQELNKIKDININFGDIVLLDDETERRLIDLANAQLDTIDFESFYTQLEKVPVEPRLSTVATELETLANGAAGTSFASNLRQHATDLRNLDQNEVSQLEQTMRQLRGSLQTLQGEIEGSHGSATFTQGVNDLILSMNTAESRINNEGSLIISDFLFNLANSLYQNAKDYVEDIAYDLQFEIGKCEELYDALDIGATALCESFLDPWNTFWFSMGWCLILLLPCMVCALVLVSEYRKTDDYEPTDNKSFDDPNFDAYAGAYPGDNIPLEDVDRRKNPGTMNGGFGQPNTAYYRDVSSPNSNYNRDSYYHRNSGPYYGNTGGYAGGGYPASTSGYGESIGYSTSGTAPPNPPHYFNNRTRAY